ncbi:hypothetical protein P12x_005682 [Tundrisphaera lichenicola]|uniref:hypothetical protein n=1 Tax=Tundrisphaera lichenicola TaxID=2029860 RepID=UPI003EB78B21
MRHGATLALIPIGIGIVLSMVSTPAQAAGWTLPDESRGHRIAPLLLLSRPDIRDDLQLPAAMVTEVDRAIDDLFTKAAALKGQTGDAAIEGRRAVDEGERVWLETRLSPEQRERLAQLELQWEGPAAMASRPIVAEALALSDDQKTTLARAVAECRAHKDEGFAAQQALATQAIATLSEGQKLRWERMLGRPFSPRATSSASR